MVNLNSNKKLSTHLIHEFFQKNVHRGFLYAIVTGLLFSSLISGYGIFRATISGAKVTPTSSIENARETLNKIKADKLEMENIIVQQLKEPSLITNAAIRTGGYSESDVDYWRTQFKAYSLMMNIDMTIVGRGLSAFKNTSKLIVKISLKNEQGIINNSPDVLVKTLDFLQLYGYVESFDGNEAVVHINDKKNN